MALTMGFLCGTGGSFKGFPLPVFMGPYMIGFGVFIYLYGIGVFSKNFGWKKIKERVGRWAFFSLSLFSFLLGVVVEQNSSFGGIHIPPTMNYILPSIALFSFIAFLLFFRLNDFKLLYKTIAVILSGLVMVFKDIFFDKTPSVKVSELEERTEEEYEEFMREYNEEQETLKKEEKLQE